MHTNVQFTIEKKQQTIQHNKNQSLPDTKATYNRAYTRGNRHRDCRSDRCGDEATVTAIVAAINDRSDRLRC